MTHPEGGGGHRGGVIGRGGDAPIPKAMRYNSSASAEGSAPSQLLGERGGGDEEGQRSLFVMRLKFYLSP